jgi:hypothetical protein
MSEFLFPSCCICYVPSFQESAQQPRADQSPASSVGYPSSVERLVKKEL